MANDLSPQNEVTPEEKNIVLNRVANTRNILIYLTVAVGILILGIFLTPGIPDEIIGEIVLAVVITFIEIRNKIKKKAKG